MSWGLLLTQSWGEHPVQVHVFRGATIPCWILQQCLSTAGTGEPQAEEDEDAVEAAKAAKEEYNRMLQEQETSLQQRHTDKMQVRP